MLVTFKKPEALYNHNQKTTTTTTATTKEEEKKKRKTKRKEKSKTLLFKMSSLPGFSYETAYKESCCAVPEHPQAQENII